MTFDEVLDQVRELLRQRGRLTYGAVKRRFNLDEAYLEDIKGELIEAEQVAKDEDGKVLVWTDASPVSSSEFKVSSSTQSPTPSTQHPAAERRQLTVEFIDLIGSTALSARLDPEELREIIRTYQKTSVEVIERYGGHVAQYLGDGLLVYFGYPSAHEDDAARAIRAGLEIIEAIQKQVPSPCQGVSSPSPFQGEGSPSGARAGEGSGTTQFLDSPHPSPFPILFGSRYASTATGPFSPCGRRTG
jgi:hypothetical protein